MLRAPVRPGQARPGLAAHLPHHRSYPCLGNTCTTAHAPATPSPFEVLFWPDFALDSPLQTRHMGLCRARPCLPAPGLAAPSGGKAEGNTSNSSPACPCDGRGWGGELVQLKNKQNKTTRKPSFLENNLEEGVLNFVSVISVFIQPNLTSVQRSLKRSETNSALPQCLDGKSFKVVISAIVCS